ncbi:hypothetical protein [Arthrobacter luteolus]|uniref:hypothetical protein n=1 Tax=Arthrobacter luteolus TaxID=98672 RepID=UPI000835D14B|nr:hypothetical protein [Arthrobacter luteolus]
MSRISTRAAARLRQQIYANREVERQVLEARIRMAKSTVADLKAQLDPARRLRLQQGLARWEAIVDSLEDDGVYPDFGDT